MIAKPTTAAEMALTVGVRPDAFREALRNAKFPRKRNTDWEVTVGSRQYSAMRTVLVGVLRRVAA
jgi:hypothetical protein